MKRLLLTAVAGMFFHLFCFPQSPIEVRYESDGKGAYNFYCENHDFCKYILTIDFTGSMNIKTSEIMPYKKTVSPGRNFLLKLEPDNSGNQISFRYTTRYQKGCSNPKVNPDFIYLLPVGKGKETEVFELSYLKIMPKDPDPKDWYAVGFKMKFQDTVYAARRGVVSDMNDAAKLQESGYSYTSVDNYVEIFHEDCTFGTYQVLNKIFVTLGQNVEAGDPIGLAGGEKYTSGPHVRFSVHYNYEQDLGGTYKDGTARKLWWAYVPVVFCTTEGQKTKLIKGKKYTGDYPTTIITLEMTKSQIKKWEKNKAKADKK